YRADANRVLAKVGREDQSGPLSGGLLYNHANGRFTGRTVSDLDPNALLSFLESKGMHGLVSLTKSFAFPDRPPMAETRFTGCAGTNFTLALDGSVKARTFRRYGLEVRQAETQLAVQLGPGKAFVALCPLVAIRDEGRAEVDLTIDLENRTVSFIGTGTADPRAVMKAIDPSTADLLNDLHIAGPARYSARGFVNITNLDVCNIELVADAKSFGLQRFVADECSFSFRRTGHAMVVSNLQASIFGGKMTGSVSFEPEAGSTNTRFRAKGNIDKVAFRKLVEAIAGPLADKDDLTGELSGSIAADGLLGKGMGHTIDGSGELRIRDGNVFQLPLFGKLSEMLARKVPGLGYVLRQDSADAVFSIERGKLKTDSLRIEGDILSLKSNGSYDIKADQLDFDVELRFLRNKTWVGDILQTILLPVTKLFRVRLQGRLDDPTWDSVNF
ncbi:MAG: AsmA-like C-terminal region-containing protein, partial [bacterium]